MISKASPSLPTVVFPSSSFCPISVNVKCLLVVNVTTSMIPMSRNNWMTGD
jgi:hypothetical protein